MVIALQFASQNTSSYYLPITAHHTMLYSWNKVQLSFFICIILLSSCSHSILHLWRQFSYLKTSPPFVWSYDLWWTLHADEPQCRWHTGIPHTPHRNQLPLCCRRSSYTAASKKRTNATSAGIAIKCAWTEVFLRCDKWNSIAFVL